MQRRVILVLLLVAGAITGFFGLIPPLLYGIVNAGVLGTLGFSGLCIIAYFARKKNWRLLSRIAGTVLVIALLIGGGLSVPMAMAAFGNAPSPEAGPCTVVVLGAKINRDRPSRILGYRLDTAAAFLTANPQASCVVTGGVGQGEAYSEGYVMKKYLVEKGIDPARIYAEEKAYNTHSNFAYSGAIIRQEGLPQNLVVSTDSFHQFRAQLYATQEGFAHSTGISSKTPWGLWPTYWVREFFGILRYYIAPEPL